MLATLRKKVLFTYLICICFLFVGCVSSTIIKSRPEGAEVYIDNIKQGITPLKYEDTAIAGTAKPLRLKKEGYETLETFLRKSEFQWGPCIGGMLVLFPLVWVLGYPEQYEFELQKLPDSKKVTETQKQTEQIGNEAPKSK